jgi:hypothetical protein
MQRSIKKFSGKHYELCNELAFSQFRIPQYHKWRRNINSTSLFLKFPPALTMLCHKKKSLFEPMKKSAHIVVISVINCYICKVVQTRQYILEAFGFVPTGTEVEDARTFLLHDTFKVNLT